MGKKDSLDKRLANVAIAKEIEQPYAEVVDPNYIQVSPDMVERMRETTKADLFKEVIKPDLSKSREMALEKDGINPFTKEMKISNLNDFQIMLVNQMIYAAKMWAELGAVKFAKLLLADANILLSLAPSRLGYLLKLMNTEYSIKRIETPDKKRKFFNREEGEEQ